MTLVAREIGHVYSAGTGFEVPALKGVSFELVPGELVLVLGRTGSGKSTLLKILSGLVRPTSGAVEADGEPLADGRAAGWVGMVFQNPESQLFADTVLEDAAFGPRNLGRSEADALADSEWALESVGLSPAEFGPRSPFTLSGGEARRAALAGVLAMRPRYLLLDEPTAGLDARGRRAIGEAVARARAAGVGAAVVSHDAEDWLAGADQVVALDAGRVVLRESAESLIASPEAFGSVGLRAPEVLRVRELAIARGIDPGPPTLEPAAISAALAERRTLCGGSPR